MLFSDLEDGFPLLNHDLRRRSEVSAICTDPRRLALCTLALTESTTPRHVRRT